MMTGYKAMDAIRHNGVSYKAGDALDMDDFSKNQLSALLASGVIEAVAEASGTGDADDAAADSTIGAVIAKTVAPQTAAEKPKK